jgi:hypothetical protein
LRDHPGLASCAVHCRHCGIRFLTHPRNANRRNLHCPFGCREHHRRQQANARSKKHYRTEQGRWKKKLLNGKRSASISDTDTLGEIVHPETGLGDEDISSTETSAAAEATGHPNRDATRQPTLDELEGSSREDVKLPLDGFTLDEATLASSPMLPYLAMVAGLIEGRAIRCEELLEALLRSMRQRSFDRLPRREYVLRFLSQHPP